MTAVPSFGGDPILADGEIMFHGQVVFAVVAETREAARRAARLARIEIAAETPAVTVEDALAMGTQRRGRALCLRAAAMPRRPSPRQRQHHRGELPHRRPGAFLSRRPGQHGASRKSMARMTVHCLDPASDRGAASRRPHARHCRCHGDLRMPPHGRRLRRQGEPGGAMGVPRGACRARDRPARQVPPRPRRRHDHDRQAP